LGGGASTTSVKEAFDEVFIVLQLLCIDVGAIRA